MNCAALPVRPHRRAFTLIELLVVIAIIAILAALLLPVMNVVRAKAAQGACQSQIREMIRGVKMYQDDWRVYPDALYAIDYNDGTGPHSRLYPEYIKDEKTFQCPYSPQQAKVRKNPSYVTPVNRMTGAATPYAFADFSSYDFQFRPNFTTPQGSELHFMGGPHLNGPTKWTVNAASITDDPRQLIYKNPPDNTVVTWCLYHSNMDPNGNPEAKGIALVGYLSGRVQTMPADQLAAWPSECVTAPVGTNPVNCPWQVSPKP